MLSLRLADAFLIYETILLAALPEHQLVRKTLQGIGTGNMRGAGARKKWAGEAFT